MGTTSGVVQPLYIKSQVLLTSNYGTPTNLNKEQPNQLKKALNNQPHTIHWVQNPVRVRKGITTGLCKNPRPNIYLYQCKYLERIYHALVEGHRVPMSPNSTHNTNPNRSQMSLTTSEAEHNLNCWKFTKGSL